MFFITTISSTSRMLLFPGHIAYKLEFYPNRTFSSSSGGYRKPENLFESYEDLLQRKRAQERKYRLVRITFVQLKWNSYR